MPDQDQLEAEVRNGASGTTSEEDLSEALDEDKLGGDFPPDEPAAAFEYGVTPQEQRVQEPISERVDRDIPETPVDDVALATEEGPVGRLVAPDEGSLVDDEAQAVASDVDRVSSSDLPVGDVGSGDATTYDVVTERSGDLSAEEAAMHVRELP